MAKKPHPKTQKEISISQHTPYDKERGNPNDATAKNRADQNSFKEDTVKPVYIGLEDIDNSVLYYFDNVIKPFVEQNNERIPVPVIYGSPERWKSYQKDGYYRDAQGKIMAPLIMFKMESFEKDRSKGNKLDANNPNNFRISVKKYSNKNSYDNFSVLTNKIPENTYYATIIPDYIDVTYKCVIFTNYVQQLNKVIEAIQYTSDAYWGDPERFSFNAHIDSFNIITELNVGTDRIVKSSFDIKLKGYIIPNNIQKDTNSIKKFRDKSQVVFGIETSIPGDTSNEIVRKPVFIDGPQYIRFEPVLIRNTNNTFTIATKESGERYIIPQIEIPYANISGSSSYIYANVVSGSTSLIISGNQIPIPKFTIFESNGVTVNSYRDISSPFFTLPSGGASNLSINNTQGDVTLFIISSSFNLPRVTIRYKNSGSGISEFLTYVSSSNSYSNIFLDYNGQYSTASLIPSFSIFRSGSGQYASRDISNPQYVIAPTEIQDSLGNTLLSGSIFAFDSYSLPPVIIRWRETNNNISTIEANIINVTGTLSGQRQYVYEQPGGLLPIPRFVVVESTGIVRDYRDIANPSYSLSEFSVVANSESLIFPSTTSSWNVWNLDYYYYTSQSLTSSVNNIVLKFNNNSSRFNFKENISGSQNTPFGLFNVFHYDSSSYKFTSIVNPNIYLSGSLIINSNNTYNATIKDGTTGSIPNTYLRNSGSTWTSSIASAVTSSIENIKINISGSSSIIQSYFPSSSQEVYTILPTSIILPNGSGSSSIYNQTIDIRTYASGIAYQFGRQLHTGQTSSFRAEDEADYYNNGFFTYNKPLYPQKYAELSGSSFTILKGNNIWGNTNRFTDISGSQSYANDVIQDHLTGLEWYRIVKSAVTWNLAVTSASNATDGGRTDWVLPGVRILDSITDDELSDPINYSPFNIISILWTSSTQKSTTTNAFRFTAGSFTGVAKTGTNPYIYCRRFI